MSSLLTIVHTPGRLPDSFVFSETWVIEDAPSVPVSAYFTIADEDGNVIVAAHEGAGTTIQPSIPSVSVVLQNSQVAVEADTDAYWELQILWDDGNLETFSRGHAFVKRAL